MNPKNTVEAFMHRGVITCAPDTPMPEIVRRMNREKIHAVVVVGPQQELVGVVTQTDLVGAGYLEPYAAHFEGMCAWHLMSTPAMTIPVNAPVEEAARRISDARVHRLVVVKRGPRGREEAVGILSVTDLVRNLEAPGRKSRGGERART